ncbi:MAG: hypothetical protein AAF989_16655, partial [Planctomycetota bacterium]
MFRSFAVSIFKSAIGSLPNASSNTLANSVSAGANAQVNPTMEELMRSAHDEYGISGSPFVFPAIARRLVGWLLSWNHFLFAFMIWMLHRTWGFFGRRHAHPLARAWAELAWKFRLSDGLR